MSGVWSVTALILSTGSPCAFTRVVLHAAMHRSAGDRQRFVVAISCVLPEGQDESSQWSHRGAPA